MSGDQGNLGVEPGGGVALEQRVYDNADRQAHVTHDRQERRNDLASGRAGRRAIRRVGIVAVLLGMLAGLGGWIVLLGWSAVWLWRELPF